MLIESLFDKNTKYSKNGKVVKESYDEEMFNKTFEKLPSKVKITLNDGWSQGYGSLTGKRTYMQGYLEALVDAGIINEEEAENFDKMNEDEGNYFSESKNKKSSKIKRPVKESVDKYGYDEDSDMDQLLWDHVSEAIAHMIKDDLKLDVDSISEDDYFKITGEAFRIYKKYVNTGKVVKESYGVFQLGGSIGQRSNDAGKVTHRFGRDLGVLVKSFDTAEEAKDYAARMRKTLSPGEKGYYGISYRVAPLKDVD